MNKIPLETTLAGAYRFLFTRILSIIGTLWLPFLVTLALLAGVVWLVVPHAWLAGNLPQFNDNTNPEEVLAVLLPIFAAVPLVAFVMLVMGSMMFVGLMRLSLGQTPHSYVFFSLGGDVWRLVLARILMGVLIAVLEAVLVGIFFAAMAAAKAFLPETPMILSLVVLGFVEACLLIYVAVRWFFFLPAAVVAEHKIGLGRAWELGGGNFWRIVVILLLIFIPVGFVAGTIMQMSVMSVVLSQIMRLPDHPSSAELQVFFQALLPILPVIVIVGLLQILAISGLMAGAIGTAYNAVVPAPEEEKATA